MCSPERGPEPTVVHVSDALQARLDRHRERCADASAVSVVLAALAERRADLPGLLRAGLMRPVSPHGRDAAHGRYLGTGPVQLRLRPDPEQAAVLAEVSAEVGAAAQTWVPVLLNAHLPGRREPDNMPWLERDER